MNTQSSGDGEAKGWHSGDLHIVVSWWKGGRTREHRRKKKQICGLMHFSCGCSSSQEQNTSQQAPLLVTVVLGVKFLRCTLGDCSNQLSISVTGHLETGEMCVTSSFDGPQCVTSGPRL